MGTKQEPKYKIYEGVLKDILKQCLDEGRRPLTMFEVITLRNQKKIPWQYYHTSTIENTRTGKMFDASVNQLKGILTEKDYSIWRLWYVFNLSDGSGASGNGSLSNDLGRLVAVKIKKR